MIKNLLKNLSTELFSHETPDLIFLKWLIACRYDPYINCDQREKMLNAFRKSKLESDTDPHELSDAEYANKIYNYALDKLPRLVQKKNCF